MSISTLKTRLADLQKKIGALGYNEQRMIVLQPGEALPEGESESDYDVVIKLRVLDAVCPDDIVITRGAGDESKVFL